MATFLLLYSGGKMPEGESETKQVMDAWGTWLGKYQGAVLDAGNPFTPVAKTISADGRVSDGPVGEPASGYTVIKADSLDRLFHVQAVKGDLPAETPSLRQPVRMTLNRGEEPAVLKAPVHRTSEKVGRNDPCPCGSGKKFKKCHGR